MPILRKHIFDPWASFAYFVTTQMKLTFSHPIFRFHLNEFVIYKTVVDYVYVAGICGN